MRICIIGLGKLGASLAAILESKKTNCQTCGWDVVETKNPIQAKTCDEAVNGSDTIFLVVPSQFLASSLKTIKTCKINPRTVLVSFIKGLDPATKKIPIELIASQFPKNPAAVVSGPMLSEEIINLPTRATIACSKKKYIQGIQDIFNGTNLSLEFSNDIKGVSWLGVLKNVYALATGVSDGLELGYNFRSCLALQSLREIKTILKKIGGKETTIFEYAGIGDYLTTAFSPKSRNYNYGFSRGRGTPPSGELAEGVKNLELVHGIAGRNPLPVLNALKQIFINGEDPKNALLRSLR